MALKEDAGKHLLDAHALGPSGSSAAVEGDTGEDGGSGLILQWCGRGGGDGAHRRGSDLLGDRVDDGGGHLVEAGEVLVEVPLVEAGAGAQAVDGEGSPLVAGKGIYRGVEQSGPPLEPARIRGLARIRASRSVGHPTIVAPATAGVAGES